MTKDKTEKKNTPSTRETVALTGSGFKGKTLLRYLEQNPQFSRVIFLDYKKPDFALRKTKFYRVDLTETLADVQLADILKKERVDTLVHTAMPITPPHKMSLAHELVSVGSMYVCNAAADAKVRKLVLASTADVYGAFPDNPNYLTEKHPARGGRKCSFLRDKIDAENQFLRFARKHPDTIVTILRPATILGAHIRSFKTKYLAKPVVPVVLGYDPLVQFIHEDDLLTAFKLVIEKDHPGIFNLASEGVLPLSKAIRLMGKFALPLSLIGLKTIVQILWYLDISPAPANRLEFLKYMCLIDTEKAKKELNFRPKYSGKDALLDFVGAERLRHIHLSKEFEF